MPDLDISFILPEQIDRRRIAMPEFRLVAAVFESVLHDLRTVSTYTRHDRHRRASHTPRETALLWLESDDEGWPYSFVNCCHLLQLNIHDVREKILGRKAS